LRVSSSRRPRQGTAGDALPCRKRRWRRCVSIGHAKRLSVCDWVRHGQMWISSSPNTIGRPSDVNNLRHSWWYSLLTWAGLPRIRIHDLRHTCATLLLARGINVKVVSEMLGHANIAITLSIYGHVLPHLQQHAAATMDELLGGKRNAQQSSPN